jgi:hypothetical protein
MIFQIFFQIWHTIRLTVDSYLESSISYDAQVSTKLGKMLKSILYV